MIKKAFIPAAGLGSRLGKLTVNKPKALIEVNGQPMLEITIERLKRKGINHFMVNVHHFSEQIIDFIAQKKQFGVRVEISDESENLLDTGGAIKKASGFFIGDELVLVHNVDIISDIDLNRLLAYHVNKQALATLCVRKRKSGRVLLFNKHMNLTGWKNTVDDDYKWVKSPTESYQEYAYSGIYLTDSAFTNLLPYDGKFSIIDAWLKMAESHIIVGYPDPSTYWFDLGTQEKISIAASLLKDQESHLL